ncbi:MAG: REP-associated tyrosine transposase [Desulfuromonadaceae bacterium]
MARPLRIEFPGAVYHVTTRGNARADIFEDNNDRILFCTVLSQVVKRFNWHCHAYCLMNNHYHLLIETPDGNLSAGMRQLNGIYTQSYNRRSSKDGHLFKGRFKAVLVEKESHLLELCRYVVLNPVRARMVKAPDDFEWSSYLPTLGKCKKPDFLTTDWILANFSSTLRKARIEYQKFVMDGIQGKGSPWEQLSGQIILGSETFLNKLKDMLGEKEQIAEFPRIQRFAGRPLLGDLFPGGAVSDKDKRNRQIHEAHIKYGYTLKEISSIVNVHYTTISKVINHKK